MFIPITTVTLILLSVAVLLLSILWPTLSPRLRSLLIRLSIFVIVLHLVFLATKWNTSSERLNVLINWCAIACYELLILRFSCLSPRWLTLPSAVVLLVPVFSSSVLLPLTAIFLQGSNTQVSIGNHLVYDVNPWYNPGGGNAGVDVKVYYRPPLLPFLRHKVQSIPFNDHECNSSAATAAFIQDKKLIVGICPNWPSQPTKTLDKSFPLH
jgi:hypothetical protein